MQEAESVSTTRRAMGRRLATLRRAAGQTQAGFAPLTGYGRSTVANVELGRQNVGRDFWARCDVGLDTGGTLAAGWDDLQRAIQVHRRAQVSTFDDAELDALELARRVAASDVGEATLRRLEVLVDELAVAYPVSSPEELLRRVQTHLRYVARLLDGRKTLSEHRRLLVVGGWLSLLSATLSIDLALDPAATAGLRTAMCLAREAEHPEILAWCLETDAWRTLTEGEFPKAVELSRAAQVVAPRGSSAEIQATAQEGRAWARLRHPREANAAITRVGELLGPTTAPRRPQHHFHYDPGKYTAYTATTLAWLGDPAAEGSAREVIATLQSTRDSDKWPRRIASANLDLALALLTSERVDEAVSAGLEAVTSGRVVPSNQWRALEVLRAVESHNVREAEDLREAYEMMKTGSPEKQPGSPTGK